MQWPKPFLDIKILWRSLTQPYRRGFGKLVWLSILASCSEVLSIGSLLPFLSVMLNPEALSAIPTVAAAMQSLGIGSTNALIVLLGCIFGTLVVMASLVRWALSAACARYAYRLGGQLGQDIFRRALQQPYAFYLSRHSSEVIDVIINRVQMVVSSVFMAGLSLLTNLLMVLIIIGTLIWFNPWLVGSATALFGLMYVLTYRLTRHRLSQNSRQISALGSKRHQLLQEGMGGFRDISLDNTADYFVQAFRDLDDTFRKAQYQNAIISTSPRYLVEGIGTLLIAVFAVALAIHSENNIQAQIPTIGMLIMASQRMIPMLQQIYASFSSIRGMAHSLSVVREWVELPLPQTQTRTDLCADPVEVAFNESIALENIVFSYQIGGHAVLNQLSLSIKKGQHIGLCGKTGIGKSTLLDILMGLLLPTQGQLVIDGEALNASNIHRWQRRIAHVPQHIFLADTSIAQNIAFGRPESQLDMVRIKQAAEQAHLTELIESTPNGYDTMVGERGIRLSGGQRQRIGIARALYKQADLLVLDEATSALDPITEEAITASLAKLNPSLTVVMVSHRPSALKNCHRVYRLEGGKLVSDS
jgi:ABC-type bacteriocin/lantibiotic exporter with double-glycine peptidase domain